jgi:hypothetical protein
MKTKRTYSGFSITELILAVAIGSILVLTIGTVMLDTQRGWMDSYSKVHGGAATDAAVVKTAFDKVVRKASRSGYYSNGPDDITVYYYDNWLTSPEPDKYARFYRSQDEPTEMYVQHGDYEGGVQKNVLAEVLVASHVADLEFMPVSGGMQIKLALDDGRETTTMVSTAILHNE